MNDPHFDNQSLGQFGEQVAEQALVCYGFEIITRNWRCAYGEIDIVARDSNELVFIEVKTRSTDRFGSAEEAVTEIKQQHLLNSAQMYLEAAGSQDIPWRIDVCAIEVAPSKRVVRLRLLKDAVRAESDG